MLRALYGHGAALGSSGSLTKARPTSPGPAHRVRFDSAGTVLDRCGSRVSVKGKLPIKGSYWYGAHQATLDGVIVRVPRVPWTLAVARTIEEAMLYCFAGKCIFRRRV